MHVTVHACMSIESIHSVIYNCALAMAPHYGLTNKCLALNGVSSCRHLVGSGGGTNIELSHKNISFAGAWK